MGTICINQLKQACKLGCSEEERAFPQIVKIDIKLKLDLFKAAKSDDLEDTINYMEVIELINKLCLEREWKLLEKMMADLESEIMRSFSKLTDIRICIYKNVTEKADSVSVNLNGS